MMIKDWLTGRAPWGAKRSPKWKTLRKRYLIDNSFCAACGGAEKLEVHHIVPFYIQPNLELEINNLITLCESKKYGLSCHFFVGHLGSWKSFNPFAVPDSNLIRHRLLNRNA